MHVRTGVVHCAVVTDLATRPRLAQARAHFADVFAQIAAGTRDRELTGSLPVEAVASLKEAGFGTLRVPAEFGGWGLDWPEITALWIDLAAADANLAQALRGHFVLVEDIVFRHRRGEDHSRWFARFVAGEIAGNAWTETGSTAIGDAQTTVHASRRASCGERTQVLHDGHDLRRVGGCVRQGR